MRMENGQITFVEDSIDPRFFGRVVLLTENGLVRIEEDIPMEKIVQVRREVGDQDNISRMERQKEYMKNFLTAFTEKTEESDLFVLETYEQVTDYIVTDLVASSMSNIWNKYSDYTLDDVVTLQGENVLNEGHYEFVLDEAALDQLILQMFYAPKN